MHVLVDKKYVTPVYNAKIDSVVLKVFSVKNDIDLAIKGSRWPQMVKILLEMNSASHN